jgi:hypothetical protein
MRVESHLPRLHQLREVARAELVDVRRLASQHLAAKRLQKLREALGDGELLLVPRRHAVAPRTCAVLFNLRIGDRVATRGRCTRHSPVGPVRGMHCPIGTPPLP